MFNLFFEKSRILILLVAIFFSCNLYALPSSETQISFNSSPAFIEKDLVRGRLYISLPDENSVKVLSIDTLTEIDEIDFGQGKPFGLDLSNDGDSLYVAVSEIGVVSIVDLNSPTFAKRDIDVSSKLAFSDGSTIDQVYYVLEAGNTVFVSADPGSSGLSTLASIDLSDSDKVNKADTNIIRDEPFLVADKDGENLYVKSNDTLFHFQIDGPSLTLVKRKRILTLGTGEISLSGDEEENLIDGALVIDTETFAIKYDLNSVNKFRFPRGSLDDESNYFVSIDNDIQISVLSAKTPFFVQSQFESTCGSAKNAIFAPGNQGVFLINDDSICYMNKDNDEDEISDFIDNCPIENTNQLNTDNDKFGNVCDQDDDGDGLKDNIDPFPLIVDGDNDGIDDWLDQFPEFFGASQDTDRDGKPDNFFINCDTQCVNNSGLVEDTDDDDDEIIDTEDSSPKISDNPIGTYPNSLSNIELNSESGFWELDYSRNRAYISMPNEFKVLFVSLENLNTEYELNFEYRPTGLSLSKDSGKLFVALSGQGTVAAVDLNSAQLSIETVNVAEALGSGINPQFPEQHYELYDVYATSNRVFVTSTESGSNMAYFNIDDFSNSFDTNVSARNATIITDNDDQYLYVIGSNAATVEKFDLNNDDFSTIASYFGNSIFSNKASAEISIQGDLLFLNGGLVIETDTMVELNRLAITSPAGLTADSKIVVTAEDETINLYDSRGLYLVGELSNECKANFEEVSATSIIPTRISTAADNSGFIVLMTQTGNSSFIEKHQLCFIPLPTNFNNGFPPLGGSIEPLNYFPLTPMKQRLYSDNGTEEFSRFTTMGQPETVNGQLEYPLVYETFPRQEILESTEFYSADNTSISVNKVESTINSNLVYSPPIPFTPNRMSVGATKELPFGSVQINSNQADVRAVAEIIAYEKINLPGGLEVYAYKINLQQILSRFSDTVRAVGNYWLADGLGYVQFEGENNQVWTMITPRDNDEDGKHDYLDNDDDNDGVVDENDVFPLNPGETKDTDEDGIGDNEDTDDDNDNVLDTEDNCPLDSNPEQEDICGSDGICFPILSKNGKAAIICL